LRSYLDPEHPDKRLEIGCEPTLGEHLAVIVGVMAEVRRVLKPSGVAWVNYGDCYAAQPNGRSAAATKATGNDDRTFRDKPFSTVGPIYPGTSSKSTLRGNGHIGGGPKLKSLTRPGPRYVADPRSQSRVGNHSTLNGEQHDHTAGRISAGGYLKPKDLCLVPQRLAIALQEDGWWIRSLLPWVKRNGLPESISDRPANSVEYVIMLTKSARYAYDGDAVRRAASPNTNARVAQNVEAQRGSDRANGGAKTNGPMKAVTRRPKAAAGSGIRANESYEAVISGTVLADRNFRNSDLFFDSLEAPYGLISAPDGTPIGLDVCPQGFKGAHFATFPEALAAPLLRAGNPNRGPVLDPFGGAGTVGLVAARLGMDCTLIELNSASAEIADRRLRAALAPVEGKPTTAQAYEPGSLFAGVA